MIKDIVTRVIIFAVIAMTLSGCDGYAPVTDVTPYEYSDYKLTYDGKTNIVYIDNVIKIEDGGWYHIYTPYYSKNGKLCRFVDSKMIEIDEEER